MQLRDSLVVTASFEDNISNILKILEKRTYCRPVRIFSRTIILRCKHDALKAANILSWTPGVELASYGILLETRDVRGLARRVARILVEYIATSDKYYLDLVDLSGQPELAADLKMQITTELIDLSDAKLEPRKPDKLFLVMLLPEGKVHVSLGYKLGLGGLTPGSAGKALVLYSGSRASVHALLRAAIAGFQPIPLYVDFSPVLPSGHLRRAIMSAALLLGYLSPATQSSITAVKIGSKALAAYIEAPSWAKYWVYHRLLAAIVGCLISEHRSLEPIAFIGLNPSPGYIQALYAYIRVARRKGFSITPVFSSESDYVPYSEELDRLLKLIKQNVVHPAENWDPKKTESLEARLELAEELVCEDAKRNRVELRVDACKLPEAVYAVLDEYLRVLG